MIVFVAVWVSSVSLDGCPASLQASLQPRIDGCPASLPLSAAEAPPNASPERYGDGWRCNPGYREREGACLAIELQQNAHATGSAYGDGWVCKRGYAKKTGRCDPINVPENAFLLGAASVWKCERGYRRDGEMCSEITVPENGYPTGLTYGAGWKCLRGFKPDGDRCVEILAPEGGYLSDSGLSEKGWECTRGFRNTGDACEHRRRGEPDCLAAIGCHCPCSGSGSELISSARRPTTPVATVVRDRGTARRGMSAPRVRHVS